MLVKLFFDNRIIDILYILNKSICSVKYVLKWFVFIPSSHCNRLPLDGNARNFCVSVVHFTGHNWIPKTVYCIKHVTICKILKIALLRGSMVVTYYINLFWKGTDRYNGISQRQLYAGINIIEVILYLCRLIMKTSGV